VTQVVLKQPDRDGLQGLRDGGDLGQDVDAALVLAIIRCKPRTWPSIRRRRWM
jgi:hypothetical protein